MSEHKFRVGQAVEYHPPRGKAFAPAAQRSGLLCAGASKTVAGGELFSKSRSKKLRFI